MDNITKKESLTQRYSAILKAEGFDPQPDKDGDIFFMYEGGQFIIILDSKDEPFFRLCYPAFLKCDTEEIKTKALAAINGTNIDVKVGKAFYVKETCWAVVEAFLPDPSYLTSVLTRYLNICQLLAREVKRRIENM